MNIAIWLERAAAGRGAAPAIYSGKELVCDYAGFAARAAGLAGWLAGQGVKRGDRVGLFLKNSPDYLVLLFACWRIGAVAVPINAKLHGREAAWILADAEARMCFTGPATYAALAGHCDLPLVDTGASGFAAAMAHEPASLADCAAADMAWLFYTSGTTGRPKGVIITHGMLASMSLSYFSDVEEVRPEDATLYAAPMSHGAGLYALMHVLKAARHVVPASGGFDEAELFDLARHHGRVHMFAAPTMVKRMTDVARATGETGEGLRSVVYAGGPMYEADILEASAHFGPVFMQIYGQGECPMGITALTRAEVADRSHPRWRERLGSVGRAQAPVELRVGSAEAALPPGEMGEVLVRGATVMPGYWRSEAASAETLRGGWLHTGDMGVLDAEGYLTLKDRSKDLIISGGTNIYPREVEEALLLHAAVAEVAVVGRPHEDWGEEVVAFVVACEAVGEAALDAHCTALIARFKRPKAYIFVEALPKNNYGKVLKTELREMLG